MVLRWGRAAVPSGSLSRALPSLLTSCSRVPSPGLLCSVRRWRESLGSGSPGPLPWGCRCRQF